MIHCDTSAIILLYCYESIITNLSFKFKTCTILTRLIVDDNEYNALVNSK